MKDKEHQIVLITCERVEDREGGEKGIYIAFSGGKLAPEIVVVNI